MCRYVPAQQIRRRPLAPTRSPVNADIRAEFQHRLLPEDVHHYQLHQGSIGTTIPTVNVGASALRFFFKVTLKRRDLADAVVSVREPRRLPVVLSPEEVARLLTSTMNIKHKAALSLTYAEIGGRIAEAHRYRQ
jgi:site-specific recombinase XerD